MPRFTARRPAGWDTIARWRRRSCPRATAAPKPGLPRTGPAGSLGPLTGSGLLPPRDPLPALLACDDPALAWNVRHDLLDERVGWVRRRPHVPPLRGRLLTRLRVSAHP